MPFNIPPTIKFVPFCKIGELWENQAPTPGIRLKIRLSILWRTSVNITVIVSISSIGALNIITNTTLKYFRRLALDKKLNEIFINVVAWAAKSFLKNL